MQSLRQREIIRPDPDLIPFLTRDLEPELTDLCAALDNYEPEQYRVIPDVLKPSSLELLAALPVPTNEKCKPKKVREHPVAGPLARTMGRISMANKWLFQSDHVTTSLRNEAGRKIRIPLHRDLLDGHAVLFNYGVTGKLSYIFGDEEHPIQDNELVVLNGAADWFDITDYLPGQEGQDPEDSWRTYGGVTMIHGVKGKGFTSRNRLLVYAEGRDTNRTQIPPWPKLMRLLYAGMT